ncbi:hypothetical protein [Microbacterium sp. zg.Y909]|uniref:hypothetical protein n=1 Tax=Microbacterium sp. zg.Y909 TaxID=2969413 RepID=UPI00214C06EE|nr:hypothetical protein [Microbacterium sp. zg.Y909]MCR2828147.1 hypothetical protein [Microbacterium sp. zg.Y909]
MRVPPLARSPVPLIAAGEAAAAGLRVRDDAAHARVRPGFYAPRDAWARLDPWDRYLARVHAFHRRHPDAILTLESAAAMMRLPVFGEPRDIHVYDPQRTRSRRYGDVFVHTSNDAKTVVRRGGVLLTDTAVTVIDLMRVLPPAFGLAVADAAVSPRAAHAASVGMLRDIAVAGADRRGRARLALLLPLIDARSESAGESVSRAVMLWLGYEEPEPQVAFTGEGAQDRVDFFWRRASVIGESDGYGKYVGGDVVARVVDEKRREDRLRRQVRAFARWDWAATLGVAPLDQRLAAAGVPRVRATQTLLLATLRHNPRSLTR